MTRDNEPVGGAALSGPGMPKPERIQKILSAHGVASRREAERLVESGRVTVNGQRAELGQSAVPGRDAIEVDGAPLRPKSEYVYIMLNKPPGFVTTVRDERGRKTVMGLVRGVGARVYPVGRLDMYSEGLLLLTNDGQFANAVAHPSNNKKKTYEARIAGDASGAVQLLRRPMQIDSCLVKAADVSLLQRTEDGGTLQITVHEGRNRQIRKMCALCGIKVLSLKRTSIGALRLGQLEAGRWRHLTDEEIKSLCGR